MTMFSALSSFTGAATMTFLTPWRKYSLSVASVRNAPVASMTMSHDDQSTAEMVSLCVTVICCPSTVMECSACEMSLFQRPWTVSNSRRWAAVSGVPMCSLIWVI